MVQMFRFKRARGQGMTEYIIIVGLIAILLVGVVRRYSLVLDTTIQGSTKEFNEGAGAGIQQAANQSSIDAAGGQAGIAALPDLPGHPGYKHDPSSGQVFRQGAGGDYSPAPDPR